MSDAGHEIVKCSCGAIIRQCRCMSPDKPVRVIENECGTCKSRTVPPDIAALRASVTRDFGPKCPDFHYACHVCAVHMAVDILDDAYWVSEPENTEKPSRHILAESPANSRALSCSEAPKN